MKLGTIAIGVDGYNTSITGDVTMTVTCAASDFHHVPLVITQTKPKSKTNENKRSDGEGGANPPHHGD